MAAACEGLLAAGTSDLAVLDNHGGNTVNVSAEALPAGARLETWRDFDLLDHGVDATFQLGYHPRGGIDGFLSHTYVPGLRLRVDGELISESHGRAWASGVPLLGITGNDLHQQTLGSLSQTPFLVTQKSIGRSGMSPIWDKPEDGRTALREFAERCLRSGWTRSGEVEFSAQLRTWRDAREFLAAAMNAALVPFLPYWLGAFDSAEDAAAADQQRVGELQLIFDAWAAESHPQWYTAAADPLPAGVTEELAARDRAPTGS